MGTLSPVFPPKSDSSLANRSHGTDGSSQGRLRWARQSHSTQGGKPKRPGHESFLSSALRRHGQLLRGLPRASYVSFFPRCVVKKVKRDVVLRHLQALRSVAQASFNDHETFGFPPQVMLLLSAFSANMGVMDMEDCTPLHFAAVTGDLNCCKFLAQRGAVSRIV